MDDKQPTLLPTLDLMSAEQWKGLLICLLYAGTSTAISMVNKVCVVPCWAVFSRLCVDGIVLALTMACPSLHCWAVCLGCVPASLRCRPQVLLAVDCVTCPAVRCRVRGVACSRGRQRPWLAWLKLAVLCLAVCVSNNASSSSSASTSLEEPSCCWQHSCLERCCSCGRSR